jgi:hypothetical protein
MNDINNSLITGQRDGDDPALTHMLRNTYAAPTDSAYWAGLEQRVVSHVEQTHLLRSVYAAPADPSYWAGLEQRILTRTRESGAIAWWAVFSEWRAAGMVAAAAAIFLVGATTIREQQMNALERERAAMAIEANPFDTTIEPVNIAISPSSPNSQRGRSTTPERYLDLIRP